VSEGAPAPVPDWLSTTASYAWRMLVVAGVALLCWLFFQQLKLIVIGMVLRSTAWRRAPHAREIDPLKGSGHDRLPA
jgi:hypothetical protein